MFCTSCGASVEDGSKFCDKCGASLEVTNKAVELNQQTMQNNVVQTVGQSANNGSQTIGQPQMQYIPPQQNINSNYNMPTEKNKKGKGSGTLIVVILVTLLLVIATAIVVILVLFKKDNTDVADVKPPYSNEIVAGDIEEELPAVAEVATEEPQDTGDEIASAVEATLAAKDEIDKSVSATQAVKDAEATKAAEEREAAVATQAAIDAANEYIIPDSDSRYLTISDLRGLTKEECRYARNEIVARKGRKFKDQELQDYFESKSWYHGYIEADKFNENDLLNDYERENMYLIKEYENNYNKYN